MIICVCKRVSCRDLNTAIDGGVRTWAALREELGIGTTCGRCACEARRHLRERTQGCLPAPARSASVLPGGVTECV
ncbi:MAG: hypothetical protein CMK02_11970 [Polycyclovorans sp.]|jgi:bacterioferritin-associated ferredoxin|nr:hypothetical protein [Polycyclovorans sp.]MBU0790944.1 (2Fe-2S)-binding protein [Gammaproteobacteria bacterium]|tara:strand:+ start:9937 stop:10164 length:228 start_codon:yes stop_codon:yes gene_type:complete